MFYNRIVIRPQLGKADQVRSLLEERIPVNQASGPAILTERLFGKGPSFVAGRWFDDLEVYEKNRESLAADSSFGDFRAQLSQLIAANRPPSIKDVIAETNSILAEPTAQALFKLLSSAS